MSDPSPARAADPAPDVSAAVEAHRSGNLTLAEERYRAILHEHPRAGLAWFGLGSVNAQRGNFHTAIVQLERAMAITGPRAEMQHNLAGAKAGLGRFAEAEAHFREALRLRPDYPEACYNLSQLRLETGREALIERIETMLGERDRSAQDQCFLHFAAGKLLDELHRYDAAFAHYRDGNAARGRSYDAERQARFFTGIREQFGPDRIRELAARAELGRRFVFIVGMPRSGTSLVEQILSAHPGVHAAGELPDVAAITRAMSELLPDAGEYPQLAAELTTDIVAGFGEAYERQVGTRAPRARLVTDKMPLNFRHLGLIAAMLPAARVIHCRRNAADTCLSCFFQNFRDNHDYSFSLDGLADFYTGYRGLMRHWEEVLPTAPLQVDYESVTDDLETEARRLVDYVGLPWDPACLRYNEVHRPVTTASRWQVRQPIYRSSRQRWRHYAEHLRPLTDALTAAGIDY